MLTIEEIETLANEFITKNMVSTMKDLKNLINTITTDENEKLRVYLSILNSMASSFLCTYVCRYNEALGRAETNIISEFTDKIFKSLENRKDFEYELED